MKNINNIKKNKSMINEMKVEDFFKAIEEKHNIPALRSINVKMVDGQKIPCGEKNSMTSDEIKEKRGFGNTCSFALKWIPDLFMIDFDFKEDIENHEFYQYCMKAELPYVETKKGYHFYCYFNHPDKKICFSNQQKVYKDDKYEIDLIKINNSLESKEIIIKNIKLDPRTKQLIIPNIHWNMIIKYLPEDKLNMCDYWKWEDGFEKPQKKKVTKKPKKTKTPSPPVSPTTTEEEEDTEEIIFDPVDWTELRETLFGIKDVLKFNYATWWKIGSAVHKITGGSADGKKLFLEWSEQEINVNWNPKKHVPRLNSQWGGWVNSEFSMGTLKHYYNEDNPNEKKNKSSNPYKEIYLSKYRKDDNDEWEGFPDPNGLVKLMNEEFIFIRETGEIICLDGDEKWYLKKPTQFKELLCKYDFKDPATSKTVNIAQTWLNHINRRQVLKLGFDPRDKPEEDIFNIWKGMRISKYNASTFEEEECKPLLDHIKNRWCNGVDADYEYVMNWLAHLIQKPYIKMGVVICLRSTKEGAGKGIVMNLLRKIIGDNHYFQCNNLEQLTGSFNGIGEAKILTNLDEAFWGKDKKKEGMLKNLITEETKLVNKKNKESYIIDDYSNYIVSTNNDCFIPAVEGGRRFFAIELSNELSGIQTPEKKAIIDELLNVPAQAFAKVLYERDITSFNPRQFNKTALLQEQIQHNWCSVRKWWFDILTGAGFSGASIEDGFCDLGNIPTSQKQTTGMYPEPLHVWGLQKTKYKYGSDKRKVKDENGKEIILDKKTFYEKDFIYSNYEENCNGYKLDKAHFWINYKKFCVGELMKEAQFSDGGAKKRYIMISEIADYREKFNQLQEYEYEYNTDDFSEWE